MTQLDTDTLRRALRTRAGDAGQDGAAGEPLDVSAIISQGRGLRRRRRAIAVAGGACAAAAVFGIATGISHLVAQPAGSHQPSFSPQPAQHGALPGGHVPAPSMSATPTAGPASVPSPSPSGTPSPTRSAQGQPTPMSSISPTGSPTATGGPTATPIATDSPTATPTGTATP